MKQIMNSNSGQETSLQKSWNILMPFLVYFVVHDLAQVLLVFLVNMAAGLVSENMRGFMTTNSGSVNGLLNALSLVIGMVAVWPMAYRELRKVDEERQKEKGEKSSPKRKAAWAATAVFAVTLALGMNIVLSLVGLTQSSQSFQNIAQRQYGVDFVIGLLIYGGISPLAEEIVFRGLIFNRMKRYFPAALSVIVCGILFGLYHGNIVQAVYGTVLGVAITYSYHLMGHFGIPVLFHGLANVSVFVLGYNQKTLVQLSTVGYGMIFLTVAAVSLYVMIRNGRVERTDG